MRWVTWPGSFFHELAHQLACYAMGHKVLEVRYIIRNRPDNVVGYVRHQGPSGVVRELIIGIAPLVMGIGVWSLYVGLARYLTRDGWVTVSETALLMAATLVTANAVFHALPSPQDIQNVFRQRFSLFTIPCYLVASPLWLVSHNYRVIVYGWTPWHVLVVLGTLYELYYVVEMNLLSVLPDVPHVLW